MPPERLGDYLRDFDKLNQAVRLQLHAVRPFRRWLRPRPHDLRPEDRRRCREASARYMEEAADLCLSYGGSLSGEHGDGQAKGELLPKMFGTELIQAFREFKTIWDPHWRMNPGKVIDAYPLDTQSAPRPRLHAAPGRRRISISRRRRLLRARDRALLRRRQMPQRSAADDVPELPGDARGDALDARPRAPAVRDDARRPAQGRLAR